MSDAEVIDIRDLGPMVKAKRGTQGLRETSRQIGGISASTLSRVEQGSVPDLDTFARLCRWLDVSAERFIERSTRSKADSDDDGRSEIIAAHLKADRTLDPETADALARMIRIAYTAVQQANPEEDRRE